MYTCTRTLTLCHTHTLSLTLCSYRHDARHQKRESALAHRLYQELQVMKITLDGGEEIYIDCFLDAEYIPGGVNFRKFFMNYLEHTCLYVPLISDESVCDIRDRHNKKISDNFFSELEAALLLQAQRRLVIFPVFIDKADGHRFDPSSYIESMPDTPARGCTLSPKEVMRQFSDLNGTFVEDREKMKCKNLLHSGYLPDIVKMVSLYFCVMCVVCCVCCCVV